MAERPLLVLPRPTDVAPPPSRGGGSKPFVPSKERQIRTFAPRFDRLRETLARGDREAIALRDDPSSIAPDRVIVFEIAGTVDEFSRALTRIPGLEFIAEYDTEAPPDDLFAEADKRKGREGQRRLDKAVSGRFYLAMPNVAALRQFVRLWELWQRGEQLGQGFAPFKHVFSQLRALRPWGPEDRIPEETVAYWRDQTRRHPNQPVRTEVELWFTRSRERRQQASATFTRLVGEAGGAVIHEAEIPEIAYHGLLIDIPAAALPRLMERRGVAIAFADDVMFLRPQSLLISPHEAETPADPGVDERQDPPAQDEPIAALLDGVPMQGHALLVNRLRLDDPDDLQARAITSRRFHGTAMASLILHGDLNAPEPPLQRPLYVRPVMVAPDGGGEHTEENRLLIDTIYRCVVRMKGMPGEEGIAPTVFIVNISIGDPRRPFTRVMSPLARLLDYLADRYCILFLVSGGNVTTPIAIDAFDTWHAFENAEPAVRERATLAALNAAKHERTILSPAESLNAITVGSQHHDNVQNRPAGVMAVDPLDDNRLPNPSCALGLGFRRTIKPEIHLPGGREHLIMRSAGRGRIEVQFGSPMRLYGLRAASPDVAGGRIDHTALSDGTSSATALATRAAHRIFDALMDGEGGSALTDIPPEFYAVVVKALLVHRTRWCDKLELLNEICGPSDRGRHIERRENVTRFLGYGVPAIQEVLDCAENRATLVGYGALEVDRAHNYRIPLPGSLERVTEPRALTVTLAWLSPVRPRHQSYRAVKLEAAPNVPMEALGIERAGVQPADVSVKKGTIFHERYEGRRAVPFIDNGHLTLGVWCKNDAGGVEHAIRYAVAVTLETETPLRVYEEVEQRLRVRPQPPA